jgi:hypothetical protein
LVCERRVLSQKPSFFLWLTQKAILGRKSTKKLIQKIKIRFLDPL